MRVLRWYSLSTNHTPIYSHSDYYYLLLWLLLKSMVVFVYAYLYHGANPIFESWSMKFITFGCLVLGWVPLCSVWFWSPSLNLHVMDTKKKCNAGWILLIGRSWECCYRDVVALATFVRWYIFNFHHWRCRYRKSIFVRTRIYSRSWILVVRWGFVC